MILIIAAGVWMIFILIYFWVMLAKYPLRNWGHDHNPYEDETLGIPKGTIRTILALSMLFMFILGHGYALAFESIDTTSIDQATFMVLAFYFSDRTVRAIIDGKKK